MHASALLFVVALVIVACGQSERDTYRAKADDICSTVNVRFGHELRLARPTLFPFIDADGGVLADRADAMLRTRKQLRSLAPPAGEKAFFQPWLTAMDRFVASAVKLADDYQSTASDDIVAGDLAIVGIAVLAQDQAAVDAGRAAAKAGLSDCAMFKTWQVTPRDRVPPIPRLFDE